MSGSMAKKVAIPQETDIDFSCGFLYRVSSFVGG